MSHSSLKSVAAMVWLIGALILFLKAASLLVQAGDIRPGGLLPWASVAVAVSLGAIKARYLFSASCRRNLERISALERPRIWQAFTPRFFLFLTAMILLGATLSNLAAGSYPALIAVATLDISIGTALLGSAAVFRTHR